MAVTPTPTPAFPLTRPSPSLPLSTMSSPTDGAAPQSQGRGGVSVSRTRRRRKQTRGDSAQAPKVKQGKASVFTCQEQDEYITERQAAYYEKLAAMILSGKRRTAHGDRKKFLEDEWAKFKDNFSLEYTSKEDAGWFAVSVLVDFARESLMKEICRCLVTSST